MAVESKKWLKFRIVMIFMAFLVLFIALISRAFQLQVLSGQKLKKLATKQHTSLLQLPPERGVIFDRNGEKLAVSIMANSVCADPSKIIDPAKTSNTIAEILKLDSQSVFKKLSTPKNFAGWPEEFLLIKPLQWKMRTLKEFFWLKNPNDFIPTANWRRICSDLSVWIPPVWKDWKVDMMNL